MVNLILDTDIWIAFIAKNNPSYILERLIEARDNKEIELLSNEIIFQEWARNKDETIRSVTNAIKGYYNSARTLETLIPEAERQKMQEVTVHFKSEAELIKAATDRVNKTEELLHKCTIMPVSAEMKLEAIDMALNKRAPFNQKENSVGDALNLLSSAGYCKAKSVDITNSIFVSFNHTDIADKGKKDELHNDLKKMFAEANIHYTRHIGEALHLTAKMAQEVAEYEDYLIERYLDTDGDFERNR